MTDGTTERIERPTAKVRVRWQRELSERGWPTHYLDLRDDGTVSLWEQENPRDRSGFDCTVAEFLAGEHRDFAVSHVGREAYEEALAEATRGTADAGQ